MSANSARPALGGRLRLRRVVWAAAAAGAAGAAAALVAHLLLAAPSSPAIALPELHGQISWPADARPAPLFALPDVLGGTTSLAALRGHVTLVAFLDSRCRARCPFLGAGDQRRRGRTSAGAPAGRRRHHDCPSRRRRDKRAGRDAPLARPGGLALADGKHPGSSTRCGAPTGSSEGHARRAARPGPRCTSSTRAATSERATFPRSCRPSSRSTSSGSRASGRPGRPARPARSRSGS